MNEHSEHKTVMLKEAIQALNIKPDGVYVDATFGRGGHTKSILEKLSAKGRILVIDKDPEAIESARILQAQDKRILVKHGSFEQVQEFCQEQGIDGAVDGILFDLGVCSTQIDNGNRGFSFLRNGKLDMRLNPEVGISAATWINQAKEQDIVFVLKNYGEERFAKHIAKSIVEYRKSENIDTTGQLAAIISQALPFKEKHKHPATRSFQGIRIFINRELDVLKAALLQAIGVLAGAGRLVVISFHSLEDRIVKNFIQDKSKGDHFPSKLPIINSALKPTLNRIGKALKPEHTEVNQNIRSRSAILRVAEKRPEVSAHA